MNAQNKMTLKLTRKKYIKHITISFIMVCLVCSFFVTTRKVNIPFLYAEVTAWTDDSNINNYSDWIEIFNPTLDTTNKKIIDLELKAEAKDTIDVVKMYNKAYIEEGGSPVEYTLTLDSDDLYELFAESSITEFYGNDLDISNCTTIEKMFYKCSNLTKVDFGDTFNATKITSMQSMFEGCTNLKYLDMSDMITTDPVTSDTSLTNVNAMFKDDANLLEVDFGELNLSKIDCNAQFKIFKNNTTIKKVNMSKVTIKGATDNISEFFSGCTSLIEVNFGSSFDTTGIKKFSYMFYGCSALTSLDISSFSSSNVEDVTQMFRGCTNLVTLTLPSTPKSLSGSFNDMSYMFTDDNALTALDLKCFDTKNVTNMESMFLRCYALISCDFSNIDTTTLYRTISMFHDCTNITEIKIPTKNDYLIMQNVTSMENMFRNCKQLVNLDISSFNPKNVEYFKYVFLGNQKLETIDFGDNFDLSKAYTMTQAFENCRKLKKVDFGPGFKTTKSTFTSAKELFQYCWELEEVDFGSNFVLAVESSDMFRQDYKLKTVIWPNCDASACTKMSYMFGSCTSLETISFGNNFDTSNVTAMEGLFNNCPKLKTVNWGTAFNTNNVTNAKYMFQACKELESIDLSNFNFSKVSGATDIFKNALALREIKMPKNFNGELTGTELYRTENTPDGYLYDDIGIYCAKLPSTTSVSKTLKDDAVIYTDPDTLTEYKISEAIESIDISEPADSKKVFVYKYSDETNILVGKGETMDCDDNSIQAVTQLYTTNDMKKLVIITPSESEKIIINSNSFVSNKTHLEDIVNFDRISFVGTSMRNMYNSCSNLPNLHLDTINTSGITDMTGMFGYCKNTVINLSRFNTSDVTTMASMFEQCSNVLSLDLSTFNTSKVTTFYHMFDGCASIKNIDLSNFTIGVPSEMDGILVYCTSLEKADLSFDATNVTSMSYPFNAVTTLEEVKVPTHLSVDANLPYTMYDSDQNEYDMLPKGLTTSITLYKTKPPKEDPPSPPGGGGGDDDNKKKEEPKTSSSAQTITIGGGYNRSPYITGYTSVLGKKTFKPNNYITRGEVATILSRLSEGYNEQNDYKSFNDIYSDIKNKNAWYSNNLGYVTKTNVMEGYDGAFYPNDNMTRGQFAAAICRFKNINLTSGLAIETNLTDIKGRWFENYAKALNAYGYITGYEDNSFKGDKPITRAEACALINRAMNINTNVDKENVYTDVFENDWYYKDVLSSTMD